MKRYIGIGVAALLLIGAVYLSLTLNKPEAGDVAEAGAGAGTGAGTGTGTGGESVAVGSAVAGGANSAMSYFELFRQEREDARALEKTYLDEIIAASSDDAETLADANEQKLALVDRIEKEFAIENQIRAKGFKDAAVTFHAGSVSVVVDKAELTGEEVAQILEIVTRETGEKAENVKIASSAP